MSEPLLNSFDLVSVKKIHPVFLFTFWFVTLQSKFSKHQMM